MFTGANSYPDCDDKTDQGEKPLDTAKGCQDAAFWGGDAVVGKEQDQEDGVDEGDDVEGNNDPAPSDQIVSTWSNLNCCGCNHEVACESRQTKMNVRATCEVHIVYAHTCVTLWCLWVTSAYNIQLLVPPLLQSSL